MLDIPSDQWQGFVRVVIAAGLAGVVGLEREFSAKPAGFRTHMLIGGATALLIVLGEILVSTFEATTSTAVLRADPLRLIEAIIVGISFIGAGTILKVPSEERIRYLTTATSIFFSAGIGIAVALEQYFLAVGVAFAILVINLVLGSIEYWIEHRGRPDRSEPS
jgi:putative Mg2+ transporter-C (MgtC) family protein